MQLKLSTGLWTKTIFRWLIAYAVVVVLVVILVAVISSVAVSTVENSARVEHQTKLGNLQSSMDALLLDVEQALTLIRTDERLHAISASSPPYAPYQLYMLYDLNRSFSRYIAVQGPWKSMYFYVKNGGYILYNGSKFTLHAAYNLLDYELSEEAWQDGLDEVEGKAYLTFSSASEQGRNYLEYWYPYGSGSENNGVLVARLDLLEIRQRLSAMRSFNEEILILLDEDGKVLLSTQPVDEELNQALRQINSTANDLVEINGLLVGNARSQVSGWTYISVLPKDFLFSSSIFTKQVVIALCLFLFIVGLILSFIAVIQRNRPIKRMYDLAKQISPEAEPKDAFCFLEASMRDLMEKNSKVEQTLVQYHKLVRHDVLLRLLTRAKVGAEELRSARIQFRWNNFVVFLASCEHVEDVFFGEYSEDAHKLSLTAISEVLQDTFSKKWGAFTIEHEDLVLGVLSIPDDVREDKLMEWAREGQMLLKSKIGLSVTLVLSDIQYGLENIAAGYEHAKETLECELLVGSERGAVLRYRSDYDADMYILDINIPVAFSRLVKKGDFTQARVLMNRTIDTYLSSVHPKSDVARAVMFIFLNTMLDALRTADAPLEESFISELQPVQRMTSCPSIRELRTEIENIFDETERYVIKHRSDQERYINGIKSFVQEKYVDANLNVSGIANEMGVSVSMLSKLFKKKTDMGLLNYINHVRIDHACHLLSTTDLTLSEIAQQTGFLDSSTLIRNFKRTMGVTPGKYKLDIKEMSNDRR